MSSAAEHRQAITEALQPDLPMIPMRRDPSRGLTMYVGLWGLWGATTGGAASPEGLKVVLATVAAQDAPQSEVALASLPWTVLQFQSLTPNDSAWGDISGALQQQIAASATGGSGRGCAGMLVYNSTQDVQNVRSIKDSAFLAGYTVERLDEDSGAARPVRTAYRERVEYRVYRGRDSDLRPEDAVRVFMERRVPKHREPNNKEGWFPCHRIRRPARGYTVKPD